MFNLTPQTTRLGQYCGIETKLMDTAYAAVYLARYVLASNVSDGLRRRHSPEREL